MFKFIHDLKSHYWYKPMSFSVNIGNIGRQYRQFQLIWQ